MASAFAADGAAWARLRIDGGMAANDWLAQDLDGQKTANGDVQDSKLFSAAHRNLPLPSYVRVTNLDNGLETIVRVNDRGPFGSERLIDLSQAAATQLEMVDGGEADDRGECPVELRRLHAKNTTPTKPTLQWAFFCAKKKRMFCLSRSFSKFDFSI